MQTSLNTALRRGHRRPETWPADSFPVSPALRFWLAFGPDLGTVGGLPCWRLRDDLRELRLVQGSEGMRLSQRWKCGTASGPLAVQTVNTLYAALTPAPALNSARLRTGEVLTPVGRLRFGIRLNIDRFSARRITLTLMTAPGHPPVRCAGSPDWLQYTVCDPPPSHAPPPLAISREGQGHSEPAEGLRHRMNALSEAFWTALATPDVRRDLTLKYLNAELIQAKTNEANANVDAAYWQHAAQA